MSPCPPYDRRPCLQHVAASTLTETEHEFILGFSRLAPLAKHIFTGFLLNGQRTALNTQGSGSHNN